MLAHHTPTAYAHLLGRQFDLITCIEGLDPFKHQFKHRKGVCDNFRIHEQVEDEYIQSDRANWSKKYNSYDLLLNTYLHQVHWVEQCPLWHLTEILLQQEERRCH